MKEAFLESIKKAKVSKPRKFVQSVDLILVLNNIDIKGGQKIEEFISLPFQASKKKVCALVGTELNTQAEKICDKVIQENNFQKWTSKKDCKKLVEEYDYFIAQANIMPLVAKTFCKYLGVAGKMPNPKAGQIVPPNAKLDIIVPKMKTLIKIKVSKNPTINCKIGTEKDSEENLVTNAIYIYEHLLPKLPLGKSNVKKVMLKTTMGKPEVVNI